MLVGLGVVVLALGKAQWFSFYAVISAEVSVDEDCRSPYGIHRGEGCWGLWWQSLLGPPNVPSVGNLWLRGSQLVFGLACGCPDNGDGTEV